MEVVRLKITIPSGVKELPNKQKASIIDELIHALDVKETAPTTKEHNIWLRNEDVFLGEAEEELYESLSSVAMGNMATLIAGLGLSNETVDLSKAYSNDFIEYEDLLIKGIDKRSKLKDLWTLAKTKRQDFMKYIQDGSNWSKKKLKQIEDILKQKLPDYAKVAEEYAVRTAFIAKIRDKVDTEALDTLGAYVDHFPSTIIASQRDGVVLTIKQRDDILKPTPNTSIVVTEEELNEARKEWKKTKILPLLPQEVRTVENAQLRTADKLMEVADRHRKAIKQIVLQAINGRWSAQKLAQVLFDNFADQNRDWRRVAITELSMASNDAYLAGCAEGDTVWVQPVEGSCKHCKQYLEGKTFVVTSNPMLMGTTYTQEMEYVWVGKTNFGRTVATWIPCIPLHPNCRHRFQKMSRFYKVNEAGKPILRDVKELIQEERARRGMAPDPKLV